MKCELTKEGYIQITAETIMEGWALNGVWPIHKEILCRLKNQDRVIIDCAVLMDNTAQPTTGE